MKESLHVFPVYRPILKRFYVLFLFTFHNLEIEIKNDDDDLFSGKTHELQTSTMFFFFAGEIEDSERGEGVQKTREATTGMST